MGLAGRHRESPESEKEQGSEESSTAYALIATARPRRSGILLQRRHTLGMVVPRFLPEADTPAHRVVFLPARSFTFQRRQQLVLVHPHSSDWGRYTLLHTYPRAVGSHFYNSNCSTRVATHTTHGHGPRSPPPPCPFIKRCPFIERCPFIKVPVHQEVPVHRDTIAAAAATVHQEVPVHHDQGARSSRCPFIKRCPFIETRSPPPRPFIKRCPLGTGKKMK